MASCGCAGCGQVLAPSERALSLKMGAAQACCLNCLAHRHGVAKQTLQEIVAYYQSRGCPGFSDDAYREEDAHAD